MIGRVLERLGQGLLGGGLVGLLAGLTEYALLWRRQAFAGDIVKGYWDIVMPYTVAGLMAGLLAAALVSLTVASAARPGVFAARLWSLLLAAVGLAYLVAFVTFWFGPPIRKPANLVGYVVAMLVSAALFVAMQRVLDRSMARREPRHGGWLARARIPLILAGTGVALFVLPPSLIAARSTPATPAQGWSATLAQAPRPNVVFIMIDTLRADHLPMYGYSRSTAPTLAALARESAVFTAMYAQAPSTRPSIATLFSSLYPIVHKVHDNQDFLPDSAVVLAELMRDAGYQTFAVSANANVSPTFGYAQGFDTFLVWKTESALRLTTAGRLAESALGTTRLARLLGEHGEIVPRADVVTDLALDWVTQNPGGPKFLYVHYIDPHSPYRAPAPWDQKFDATRQPIRRAGQVDPASLARPETVGQMVQTVDQYDGEIAFNDHHVGRLLEGLRARGVLQDSIVIVTSDHGEEFFEHGQLGHGKSLYDEVLRVPFLISWPGRIPAGVHERPAGLIDVAPTLLTLLRVEPRPEMQGVSFASRLTGTGEERSARKFFAQVVTDHFSMEMVRDQRHKLIRHLHGPRRGQEEVYDLARDPLERNPLGGPALAAAQPLREELALFNAFTRQNAPRLPTERAKALDRDTERALRSLGYIK